MVFRQTYLWAKYRLVDQLLCAAKQTRQVQREVLFRQLHEAADSDFGRDHCLGSIRKVADFRRQLPIATFENFRPYVERVKRGQTSAMFGPGTKVFMFALTSGTTDKPKFVPVTERFFQRYTLGWRIWGLSAHAQHRDLLQKKYVHVASDWRQYTTPAGIWCGNISGLAAETRPWVTRPAFLVPLDVCRVSDWRSRQYVTLRLTLASRKVGMVITANPLTLVGMAQFADAEKESLVRDLHDGTLADHVEVSQAVRTKLRWRLKRRHVARSRELGQIIERTGTLYPRDFWPQLSVVAVWTGGAAGAFLPALSRYYGEPAIRDHGLSASEGRMTIPLQDGSSAGILDLTSNYYEFIPVDEYGTRNQTVLEADELEVGKDYYILLSTSSGFYRYDIQDVVRCVGFEATAPILKFLHKGAHCSNIVGEKLTELQVATAVKRAFADLHRPVDMVMLMPVMGEPPGYVLLVEVQANASSESLAHHIDAHLRQLNCEYANRLETDRLLPLRARILPPGSWKRLQEHRVAAHGGSHEQYKHAFLTSRTDVVHQLVPAANARDHEHAPHRPIVLQSGESTSRK